MMKTKYKIPGAVIPGTAIYILNAQRVAQVRPNQIRCFFWDWDGNFSLLRMLWQLIMAPMMVDAICGDQPKTRAIRQAVHRMIDETTGIRTIEQMRELIKMIREYSLVPEAEIHDEWYYKKVYLDRLMVPVNRRIRKVQLGQCRPEAMMLAGAMGAVRTLYHTGVTQLVFSGTDRENVVHESGVLTASQYFEAIFGAAIALSPGEVEKDKEDVLREEIARRGLSGAQIAGGGDGKVEIIAIKEAGGLAIGVASNEKTGRGWDLEKAQKLIKAGADVIMPDWRWYRVLIEQVLLLKAA